MGSPKTLLDDIRDKINQKLLLGLLEIICIFLGLDNFGKMTSNMAFHFICMSMYTKYINIISDLIAEGKLPLKGTRPFWMSSPKDKWAIKPKAEVA